MSNMNDSGVKKLIGHIQTIIDRKIDERLANVMFAKPATVETVSADGLDVSVKMLADDTIIEDVKNYNSRSVKPGIPCHIVHWGAVNRLNNKAVLFGGTNWNSSPLGMYPVGSIYMSVNDVNPGTFFGGTWEAWGSGRVPVGVGTGAFAGVETETGTLEHNHPMINHLHVQTQHAHRYVHHHRMNDHWHGMGAHTHALTNAGMAQVTITDNHNVDSFTVRVNRVNTASWHNSSSNSQQNTVRTTHGAAANLTRGVPLMGNTGATSGGNTGGNAHGGNQLTTQAINAANNAWVDNTDNSAAMNTGNPTALGNLANRSNVQPSITCYMWKRVA